MDGVKCGRGFVGLSVESDVVGVNEEDTAGLNVGGELTTMVGNLVASEAGDLAFLFFFFFLLDFRESKLGAELD